MESAFLPKLAPACNEGILPALMPLNNPSRSEIRLEYYYLWYLQQSLARLVIQREREEQSQPSSFSAWFPISPPYSDGVCYFIFMARSSHSTEELCVHEELTPADAPSSQTGSFHQLGHKLLKRGRTINFQETCLYSTG